MGVSIYISHLIIFTFVTYIIDINAHVSTLKFLFLSRSPRYPCSIFGIPMLTLLLWTKSHCSFQFCFQFYLLDKLLSSQHFSVYFVSQLISWTISFSTSNVSNISAFSLIMVAAFLSKQGFPVRNFSSRLSKNNSSILRIKNVKFSGYCFYMKTNM